MASSKRPRSASGAGRARKVTQTPCDRAPTLSYQYRYPHPAVTVDCVVFTLGKKGLEVLLIQRLHEPFKDSWALPGGFVEIGESLEAAAGRELREETGLDRPVTEQIQTFGNPQRDPRERVITVAFLVLARRSEVRLRARSDARRARWFPWGNLPPLAFDHDKIIGVAQARLGARLSREPSGFELLPPIFSMADFQGLYESVLGKRLEAAQFSLGALASGRLVPVLSAAGRGQAPQYARKPEALNFASSPLEIQWLTPTKEVNKPCQKKPC